jgi:nitrogen fixation/metabolism regulation signal transduction histidine kinase
MSAAEKNAEISTDSKRGHHQRSMKNILLRPEFQLKYSFYFVGMTLVTMGAVFLLFLLSLEDMVSTLAVVYRIEPEVVGAIQQSLRTATFTTIAVAVLFGIISVSLGIILTHRLVGPMVPIRRLIRQLTEGEYGVQGRLRTKDDYQEVMAELNALSKKLLERHPN